MKNRLFFHKRFWTVFFCFIFLLCCMIGFLLYNTPTRQFRRAAEKLFQEEMVSNTLSMHFTLAHPKTYGILDYHPILPCYEQTNHQNASRALKEHLEFFQGLKTKKLSFEDNHTLKILLSYLETLDALNAYPYYEEPLSPSSGMQSQLPILLAEYPFRSIRDVEDYLAILSQTGDYFDSLLTFEKEKKENGLLMAAGSIYHIAEQCRTILTKEALQNKEHFLQITFEDRLQQLCDNGSITDEQALTYAQKNHHILSEILLPAYQRLADGLTALADPAILLEGLASQPEGAAYYEALLRSETGSHRSIPEITTLLTTRLTEEFDQLRSLMQSIDYTYLTEESIQACNELFPLNNCTDMLTHLQEQMKEIFPALPDTSNSPPNIHVKEVAPCLQDYCAPAFYLTPPFDDTNDNSIYINTKSTVSAVELYTTLAHEGFPGHLYQTVYKNQLLLQQDCCPVQQLTWFGGYLEGWALYVEFLAYDYAAELMEASSDPNYATLLKIEKHNRSLQLCLYSLLDILIHHENTDYRGTAEILADFGITNSASVNTIYEYIVEEPANYPKYYLGYLEILKLKDSCEDAWGSDYSDYTFHKFFLDMGPADFKTLNELVSSYSSNIRSR